jgi:acetoin utilization protein AcuC
MSERQEAVRFVYAERLATYELSPSHPYRPVRLDLVRTLLEACDILGADEVLDVQPLDADELATVHDRDYIRAVRRASDEGPSPDAYAYGLGTGDNPIFSGMHEIGLDICAGTATAVDAVLDGAALRATSLAGGLHHAHRAKASGFCLYNDLAVAIARAVRDRDVRVAYLDIDVHHGDGVQWLFYRDPRVMTISLHESGRYLFPGTGHTYEIGEGAGKGTSVNVPLEPYTGDESFLEAFDAVVPAALRAFAPDLIVLQAGADMHFHDPLADLSVTIHGMHEAYRRVVDLADELTEGRLVATGGGGYDPYRTVPRAWAGLWSALSGRPLPDDVPAGWRSRWSGEANVELPRRMLDEDEPEPQSRRDLIRSQNRAVAGRLLDQLRPIWSEGMPRSPTPPGG